MNKEAFKKIHKIVEENKDLKEQNKKLVLALIDIRNKIRILGKFDGEKCTRGFNMWIADVNDILQTIDKVLGGSDENK